MSEQKSGVHIRVPDQDPAATKKMFDELKKRKLWVIFGTPKHGRNLIPTRKRKRDAS